MTSSEMLKVLIIANILIIHAHASFGRQMYPTGDLSPAENKERLEKCGDQKKHPILPPLIVPSSITLEGLEIEKLVEEENMLFDVEAVLISKRHLIADVILIRKGYSGEECRQKNKNVLSMLEKNSRNIVKATLIGECRDEEPFGFLILESDWHVDHFNYDCLAERKPEPAEEKVFEFTYWNPPAPRMTPRIPGSVVSDNQCPEEGPALFCVDGQIDNQIGSVRRNNGGSEEGSQKWTVYGQVSSKSKGHFYAVHSISHYSEEICAASGICSKAAEVSDECMIYWTVQPQKQGKLSAAENRERLDSCANAALQGFQHAHPIVEIPGTGWSDSSFDPPVFMPTRGMYVSTRHVITDMILIEKKYSREECLNNDKNVLSMLEVNEFKIIKASLIGECRDQPYGFLLLETAWPADHAYGCLRETRPNFHENEWNENERILRIWPSIYETYPNNYSAEYREQWRDENCPEQTESVYCVGVYHGRRDHYKERGLTLLMENDTPRRKSSNWTLAGITIASTPVEGSNPRSNVLSIHAYLDEICVASGICKERGEGETDESPFESTDRAVPANCQSLPSNGRVVHTPDAPTSNPQVVTKTPKSSGGCSRCTGPPVAPEYVPAPTREGPWSNPQDPNAPVAPTYVPAPVFTKPAGTGCSRCTGPPVPPTYMPAPTREGPWSIPKDPNAPIPPTYAPAPVFTKPSGSGCSRCTGPPVAPEYVPAPTREGPWSVPAPAPPPSYPSEASTSTGVSTTTLAPSTTTPEVTTTSTEAPTSAVTSTTTSEATTTPEETTTPATATTTREVTTRTPEASTSSLLIPGVLRVGGTTSEVSPTTTVVLETSTIANTPSLILTSEALTTASRPATSSSTPESVTISAEVSTTITEAPTTTRTIETSPESTTSTESLTTTPTSESSTLGPGIGVFGGVAGSSSTTQTTEATTTTEAPMFSPTTTTVSESAATLAPTTSEVATTTVLVTTTELATTIASTQLTSMELSTTSESESTTSETATARAILWTTTPEAITTTTMTSTNPTDTTTSEATTTLVTTTEFPTTTPPPATSTEIPTTEDPTTTTTTTPSTTTPLCDEDHVCADHDHFHKARRESLISGASVERRHFIVVGLSLMTIIVF